jgi:hypothetical protein
MEHDDNANQICRKVIEISYWDKDLYNLEQSDRDTLDAVLKKQQEYIRDHKGKWKLYIQSDLLKPIPGE